MTKARQKFCQFLFILTSVSVAMFLADMSFKAALTIHPVIWVAVDYWLAWFSFFSGIGSVALLIIATITSVFFFDGLCE